MQQSLRLLNPIDTFCILEQGLEKEIFFSSLSINCKEMDKKVQSQKFVPKYIIKGHIRNLQVVTGLQEEIEAVISQAGILDSAPFSGISLVYKFSLQNKLKPAFQRINKQDGMLSLTIEIKMKIVQWADTYNVPFLKDIFMIAALEALLHVCERFNLPKGIIFAARAKYWNIPETIEDCENMYGKERKESAS